MRCHVQLDEGELAFTFLKQIKEKLFRGEKLQVKHENVSRP